MSWIPVFLISLTSALLLFIVGFVTVVLLDVKTKFVFSSSFVTSVLIVEIASLLSSYIGWSIPVLAFVVIALWCTLLVFRLRVHEGVGLNSRIYLLRERERVLLLKKQIVYLCGGVIFAMLFLFFSLSLSGSLPTDVLQLYDAPFHLSILRHIAETGNASPFGAGVIAGNSTSVYPDVVHAISALFFLLEDIDIQTTIWITEIIFVAIFFPLGSFELTNSLRKSGGGLFKANYVNYFNCASSNFAIFRHLYVGLWTFV